MTDATPDPHVLGTVFDEEALNAEGFMANRMAMEEKLGVLREVNEALREGGDTAPFTGREAGDELDIASERAKLALLRIRIARVEDGSRAAKAGVQVNDVVLSYNGQSITTRTALRVAVEVARRQDAENILLVIERMGKRIELPVKSGSLGVRIAAAFSAPVFN